MSNAASGLAHLKPFLPGLEPLLEDAEVSEIMINGPGNVWIEAKGRLTAHAAPGLDESALLRAAIHIARPLGLDPATTPIIDARLDDGSRVAICVPPASPHVAITIRRFGKRTFSPADLVEQKALPENVLGAAEQMLMTRRNILVSGGTGSGKTTLLNALIELLPDDERIVAIEDTLELRIDHSNCVRFEARGLQEGAVTIRDLVRHALRHRPDHIVVGEVRGGEAADLLQALNTGHGGSLTTVHANNAESALSRLASCAMQGGGELPWEVTCRGVVDGIALVIHMTRREGRRFVEEAAFVQGLRSRKEPVGASSRSGRRLRLYEEQGEAFPGQKGAREGSPRPYAPQARRHFTRFDQVDQLVRASPGRSRHGVHGAVDDAVFPAPHQPGSPTSVQARQRPLHPDHDGRGSNRLALRESLPAVAGLGLHRGGADPIAACWFWGPRSPGSCAGCAWLQSGVAAGENARGCGTR